MANLDTYPDIPSPSGASFRTLDDVTPTPRRTRSPTPIRPVDERSKLLDRSRGGEYAEYGVEQAERAERRRRLSSYAVVNTGSTSGVGSVTIPGLNDGDAGELSFFLVYSLPQFAESTRWMCVIDLPGPSKPEIKGSPVKNWRKRMSYYVPVTAWIPGYSWSLCVLLHFSLCPLLHPAAERTYSFPFPEPILTSRSAFSLGF